MAAQKVSGDSFLTWGWRLPFLFSAVLVLVGLWVRLRVSEAEEFLQVRRAGSTLRYPVALVVRRHWRTVGVGVGITLVCHAAYIVTTFLPAYATTRLDVASEWSLIGLVSASALAVVVLTVVGRRADRVDRRRYAAAGAILMALWAFPAFALTAAFGGPGLVIGMAGSLGGLMMQFAVLPTLLTEQFPVEVRYTGVSACLQLSAVLGGGLLPVLASWLVARSGGGYWPAVALMVAAGLVTVSAATRIRGSVTGHGM